MSCDMRAALAKYEEEQVDGCVRLAIYEETEVSDAAWVPEAEACVCDHGATVLNGSIHVSFDDGRRSPFDFVWLATGGTLDLQLVPIFASLQAQHPITCTDGLPLLQPDLSWNEQVPLYIMGAFAQLQLGADALNLAGARSGGALIARALLEDGRGCFKTSHKVP